MIKPGVIEHAACLRSYICGCRNQRLVGFEAGRCTMVVNPATSPSFSTLGRDLTGDKCQCS